LKTIVRESYCKFLFSYHTIHDDGVCDSRKKESPRNFTFRAEKEFDPSNFPSGSTITRAS